MKFSNIDAKTLKEQLTMTEVVEAYLDDEVVSLGEWGEPSSKECPFCQAQDAFRICPDDERFICFSCDSKGDIFDFVQSLQEVSFTKALEELVALEQRLHSQSSKKAGDSK